MKIVFRLLPGKARAVRRWIFSGVLMLVIVGIGWIAFSISAPFVLPRESRGLREQVDALEAPNGAELEE